MARVKQARAGKEYTCGRCHEDIPKGEQYRWSKPGFRARRKLIRCMRATCAFRRSELTTSNMSGAFAAVEDAEDSIDKAGNLEDIKDAMGTAAEGIREVAGMYEEASDAWAGGNGHEEWTEIAERLGECADILEEWEPEEDVSHDEDIDPEEEEIDDPDPDVLQAWKDDALEVLSGLELYG